MIDTGWSLALPIQKRAQRTNLASPKSKTFPVSMSLEYRLDANPAHARLHPNAPIMVV